jgi:isopenicillin N synthase-like dioxygenase
MGDLWLPVLPTPNCLIINGASNQIAQLNNDASIQKVVTTSTTKLRFSTTVFTYFGIHACTTPLLQFILEDRPACVGRTTDDYFHFKLERVNEDNKGG